MTEEKRIMHPDANKHSWVSLDGEMHFFKSRKAYKEGMFFMTDKGKLYRIVEVIVDTCPRSFDCEYVKDVPVERMKEVQQKYGAIIAQRVYTD